MSITTERQYLRIHFGTFAVGIIEWKNINACTYINYFAIANTSSRYSDEWYIWIVQEVQIHLNGMHVLYYCNINLEKRFKGQCSQRNYWTKRYNNLLDNKRRELRLSRFSENQKNGYNTLIPINFRFWSSLGLIKCRLANNYP